MKFKSIHIILILISIFILYNIKIYFFPSTPIPYPKNPVIVEKFVSPGPKTKSVSLGTNLRE